MEAIRKYLEQEIRILESLQKSNATTDQELEKVGMTPTDLVKEYGLYKNQMLKHLPVLKQEGLIVGKQIQKKGRPGNYYAITPIGAFILSKLKLANEKDNDKQLSGLEKLKNQFPLIANHWDNELVELDKYRHQSLFNAIDYLDFKSREKYYVSLSITLPYERNFISFEKSYFSTITPKEESTGQTGWVAQCFTNNNQTIQSVLDLEPVNEFIINEINNDIKRFLTFQFYYYLLFTPKSILRIIKVLKQTKGIKNEFFKKLVEYAKQYQNLLGHDFSFNDPIRLEKELIQKSEKFLGIVESVIETDQELKKLIREQSSVIHLTFNSILKPFQLSQ